MARAKGEPGRFGASRSVVCATRGIVATSQPLAAYEAVRILEDGGNAIDAAVTAALMLSVTEPMQIGPGGDVLALVFDAAGGKLVGLNSSGAAPAAANLETLKARIGADSAHPPLHSIFAVTVPGAVDGWLALHDRFGRCERERVFAPAIRTADEGFAVAPQTAATWAMGAPILAGQGHSKETWTRPDGTPLCDEKIVALVRATGPRWSSRSHRCASSTARLAGTAVINGGDRGNPVNTSSALKSRLDNCLDQLRLAGRPAVQPAVAYGQCIAGNGVVRSAPRTYPLERGPATARNPVESASYGADKGLGWRAR